MQLAARPRTTAGAKQVATHHLITAGVAVAGLITVAPGKYYPNDIELTVQDCDPVLVSGRGAVFAITPGLGALEQLVVVQEVDRHRDGAVQLTDVIETIRSAIAEHYGIQAHSVVLVEHLSIPTTSSGKIQRGQCRQQFLNGDIAAMAQWQAPSAPDDLTKARTLGVAVTAAGILKIAMAHQQQASRQS